MSKSKFTRVLSLAAFHAWLLTKHPRTKVGDAGCEDNCPLAKFITQTTGAPTMVDGGTYQSAKLNADGTVFEDEFGDHEYNEPVELPLWAQDFVSRVDERDGSVSVMRALRITESSSLGRTNRSNWL